MPGKVVRLTYRYVPEFYYKRIPLHQRHIEHFKSRGGVQLLGGSTFPYGGAEIFLRGADARAAERLVRGDPFFTAGLVQSFELEEFEELGEGGAEEAFRAFAYICK